jgi:fibronectin-binding autotransporter adhesin
MKDSTIMNAPASTHLARNIVRLLVSVTVCFGLAPWAQAQSIWGGAGADQNWSTALNWSAGGVPNNNTVTFPDGAFPVTTNTQGVVNNIVQGNTSITSLTFNNIVPHYDTTQIPSGVTLTLSGGITVSAGANVASAAVTGGGTLIAGSNGTATLAIETTASSGALLFDLSGLNTFVMNPGASSPGNVTIANTSAPNGGTQTLNLAAVSNNITAGTMNFGNNNTKGNVTINLGNGTNILNADTINMGISKASGTMQFLNNAGGGLKIANHTGTGRTTFVVSGEANSGSTGTANNGFMLFKGGTVNILGSTMTLGNRTGRSGATATGVLAFDNGTVDVTTLNLALNISGGGASTGTVAVASSGVLKVGNGGLSMVNQGGTAGGGNLFITNGGTVICSNNIYKTTANGVATITMSNGVLTMASIAGTIGVSNTLPIDNFDITNSTLNLPVTTSTAVAVTSFEPDTATTNTINITSMPSITGFPTNFPVITYVAGSSGGNLATAGILNEIALGTLPTTIGTFSGYLSNDTTTATIWLVVTNGPVVGPALWGGQVNNLWDGTTHNWTNGGFSVAFQNGDFATFDDTAHTTTVNITGTEKPATMVVNNTLSNYTFNGVGKISGPVNLEKDGTGSLTLAETGGDDFSLGISNNAGALILDNAGSAISGGLTIASGTTVQIGNNDTAGALPTGPLDDEGTLIFDRSDDVLVSVNIPGAGGLTKIGNGQLRLSVSNAYSGPTVVGKGTLALTNSGSIANSSSVLVTNAALDVSSASATVTTLTALSMSNATLTVKVGYLQTNLTMSTLTMGGAGNTINVKSLPPIAYYPATNTLLQTVSGITGYNFTLGSLPTTTPASVGSIMQSGDGNSVLLVLTSGPTNNRPSVTWSGVDALGAVNTNWSDAQNWVTPGVPMAAEPVTFNDTATAAGGTVFDVVGDGNNGVVSPGNIDNIVDANFTNASLTYANTGTHNTQIALGKTLAVNGNLNISGSAGTTTIFGTNAGMILANSGTIAVQNGTTAPTLDMSGLDAFTANVSQIGVAFNPASAGSNVKGTWYMAKTNTITSGVGNFSTSTALVVGGGTGSTAGTGQLYLGQSNALYLDGIVLGISTSTADLIEFNPVLTNTPPVAYIRGIGGNSSRVSLWSLGDDSININNGATGTGLINDFSIGRLDALVNTLIVGQGAQGNIANSNVRGTFNMGSGNLDVTSLTIGVSDNGKTGGMGIGVMNVSNGVVVANAVNLGIGTVATTSGTLNLTNATLTLSNGITVGTVATAGTLSVVDSTVKLLNGTIGSQAAALTTLNLDGSILQVNADGSGLLTNIVATTVTAANTTTINIAAVTNLTGTAQIPLLSYTGTDPYPNLALGSLPAGITAGNGGLLVDNTANFTIDVILNAVTAPSTNASILKVSLSGTNVVIHGTNNNVPNTSFHYVVLSTPNITNALSNWTPVVTNPFNPDGTFDYTNPVVPGTPRQFLDVEVVP